MINHSEHLDDVNWFLHYLYLERQYHKAVLFRLTEIGREEKSSILKEHFNFRSAMICQRKLPSY